MDGRHPPREAPGAERLPVVLSRDEVMRLLGHMNGVHELMAGLLYGAGLPLMECVRLRVQDVDFETWEITVRQGKGGGEGPPHCAASGVGRCIAGAIGSDPARA